jgi:hypothetical protein
LPAERGLDQSKHAIGWSVSKGIYLIDAHEYVVCGGIGRGKEQGLCSGGPDGGGRARYTAGTTKPAEPKLSSPLENVLLEELRDLTVRVEVLQKTLGTAISLMSQQQRDTIIEALALSLKMTGSEDPRGVAGPAVKEMMDYALLPWYGAEGRTEDA